MTIEYENNPTITAPRRSALFVPASNPRAMKKTPTLDCDCIIFDLEDSVAAELQDQARQNLIELFEIQDFPDHEVVIRISSPDSDEYSNDVAAAIECTPDAILLSKVETAGAIVNLAMMLDYSELNATSIWAMIETPKALVNLKDVASSCDRLDCLVVGPNDLSRKIGIPTTPERAALVPLLLDIIVHGRANNLSVLDGVLNVFDDKVRLKKECEQAVSLGFDGKTLIHPAQIETTNLVFSPTKEQIVRANHIVDLFSEPRNRGKNVLNMNGEMIERLHFEVAQNLLLLNDKINR